VTTLFFDPQSEFWVVWIVKGHETMAMLLPKAGQVAQVSIPSRLLCIPNKVKLVQQSDAVCCEAAGFASGQAVVLFPAMHRIKAKSAIQRKS
jgi:hypothetical protein